MLSRAHSNTTAQSKLFTAVEQNDTGQLMELVLSTHCDPRYIQNEQHETLLHVACRLNHSNVIDMVRTLVEIYQCSPQLLDQHSLTAYHYACRSGNLEVLSYLLRIGGFHYITGFQPPALTTQELILSELESQMLIMAGQSGSVAMTRFTFMFCVHREDMFNSKFKLNQFNDTLNILCKTVDCFLSASEQHQLNCWAHVDTSLYEACCAGNLDILKFFLDELTMTHRRTFDPPMIIKSKEKHERWVYTSLLEVAYRLNNLEIAQYLTKTKGFSPVQTFPKSSHVTGLKDFSVEHLVHHRSQHYVDTCSPFHMAVRSGNIQAVRGLISHDFHYVRHLSVSNHNTLLHSACVSGKKEMVEVLMNKFKCDINVQNDNGDTPLHVACEWGHFNICLFLLEQKECNVNIANMHGHTPLTLAIKYNRLEIFQSLLTKGAVIYVTTKDSRETPLHLACCHNSSQFAEALLLALDDQRCMGTYLNTADKYGDTPLFNACRVGNVKVVQCLVAKPDIDCLYINKITKETSAHIACRMKRLDILRALVCKGSDGPVRYHQLLNHLKKSVLHVACENDAEDIVNYLIDKKVCENNNMDINGRTPLHIACMRGNTNIVKKLLTSKICNITDEDKQNNTILHYICSRDLVDPELVKLLCGDTGNSMIGKQNKDKYNPLHFMCENDGIQVFHCLLEHLSPDKISIALHSPNKDGNTPLHLAIKEQKIMTVKFILNYAELADGVSKAMCQQNSEGHNVFHCIIKYCSNHHICNTDGAVSSIMFRSVAMIKIFLQAINSNLQEKDIVLSLCQKNDQMPLTPIQYLVDRSRNAPILPVLSSLLNSRLSSNSKERILSETTSQGDTLIHFATRRNHFDVVKLLVSEKQLLCKSTLTVSNNKNESPLHIACSDSQECEIALFLCQSGYSAHQLDKSGHSPLLNAFKSNCSLLQQLIQKVIGYLAIQHLKYIIIAKVMLKFTKEL